MSDDSPILPHFLRVARSIAGARGVRQLALPLAATAAIGVGCNGHVETGVAFMPPGAGGATSHSSSSGDGGYGAGLTTMPSTTTGTGGYDGGFMGSLGDAGGPVGVLPMTDGGDAGH